MIRMKISVKGESVSDKVVSMYVSELLKAHPGMKVESVDIIVTGDRMKVRMNHADRGAA